MTVMIKSEQQNTKETDTEDITLEDLYNFLNNRKIQDGKKTVGGEHPRYIYYFVKDIEPLLDYNQTPDKEKKQIYRAIIEEMRAGSIYDDGKSLDNWKSYFYETYKDKINGIRSKSIRSFTKTTLKTKIEKYLESKN